jgi:hypothetical protein
MFLLIQTGLRDWLPFFPVVIFSFEFQVAVIAEAASARLKLEIRLYVFLAADSRCGESA